MREANYASLDAFRSALRSHPLVADYVCDLLISRGVVALKDDGTVVGVGAGSGGRAPRSEPADKGVWKDHWPDRGEIINLLRSDDETEGISFGEIQEYLKDCAEPHSHWLILHSLWNLIAAGLAEKKGKKYCLTKLGETLHPSTYYVINDALKKVGPPYKASEVEAAVRAIPGHNLFGKNSSYNETGITQETVDGWVKGRKKDGII